MNVLLEVGPVQVLLDEEAGEYVVFNTETKVEVNRLTHLIKAYYECADEANAYKTIEGYMKDKALEESTGIVLPKKEIITPQ